ncbi:hypothetical protein RM780_00555 [Streptomyces sp. DSM 44917]|uniref:Tat pathway signal sequence domain protein n=1 Tax=Streptomyces boetiae TaxID=3075541 RepID=A0ABU2L211_9ACTN|nr:hypothetical protein [Streptomyces sp. DSM 44917]MDT0305456.1 hypothetical protein [Streptomyces sp. DSM 44917]
MPAELTSPPARFPRSPRRSRRVPGSVLGAVAAGGAAAAVLGLAAAVPTAAAETAADAERSFSVNHETQDGCAVTTAAQGTVTFQDVSDGGTARRAGLLVLLGAEADSAACPRSWGPELSFLQVTALGGGQAADSATVRLQPASMDPSGFIAFRIAQDSLGASAPLDSVEVAACRDAGPNSDGFTCGEPVTVQVAEED